MFEIETADGKRVWLNALSVRAIEIAQQPGEAVITFDDAAKVWVRGEAQAVVQKVQYALRSIHTPTS